MKRLLLCTLLLLSSGLAQERRLKLEDCLQIALERNYDLSIADKQMNSAKRGVLGAYSQILPDVSFGTQANRSTQGPNEYVAYGTTFISPDTTTYYYSAGISYKQNIFDGGKWWNNIRLAQNYYKNAGINRDYNRQVVILTVTEKFYNVLKAQELLKVYEKSLENSTEQFGKTREMHRIGQVAKKDLFKAQVREGNDRLSVIQQKLAVETAIAELNLAMGLAPDTPLSVYEDRYEEPGEAQKDDVLRSAMDNNQDYNSLRAGKQSAFLQYKIARGDWFPTVSGSYTYYRGGRDFDYTYKDLNKWWNTSLNLYVSIPLFDGFRRRTNVQQKYLDYKIYEDQIDLKKITIQNQIENLLLALDTYKEMIAINELTIISAQEDLRLAQEMYRLNSATLLEVLDAQVALTRAEGNLISTKYDAKIAEVRLKLVTGKL